MILQVGNKKINIRKWKGKDKKAFIKALQEKDLNEIQVMNSLVYSCIEEDVILSIEEFKYVLSRIRAISLGEEIKIEFYCQKCGEIHTHEFLLKDIVRFSYTDLKELNAHNVNIKIGEIRNKQFYIEKIAEDPLYDLLLRVISFNGINTFTLDELMDKFDELDLDILSTIIEQYENAKFKVQDINNVICPNCKTKTEYEFDELPNFFPESWFNED